MFNCSVKNSSYILRKKKIPTNESACKCKQRDVAFACVVFAGLPLSGNETLFGFEIAACLLWKVQEINRAYLQQLDYFFHKYSSLEKACQIYGL